MADITDSDTLTLADKRTQAAILYASPALATLTDAQAPSGLAMGTQPSGGSSGFALTQQPSVQLRDGLGNNMALAGVQITIASLTPSPNGGATWSVATTNSSGLATFTDLTVNLGSTTTTTSFVVTFVDLLGFPTGLIGTVTSASFTVVPAGTDAGTLAEAVPAVALGTPADSGTLGEAVPDVAPGVATDSGALGGETATVAEESTDKSDTDAFSFADKRTRVAALDASATGTLGESGSASEGTDFTDTDSATLGESGQVTSASGNDDFVLTDELTAVQVLELGPDGTLAESYALAAGVPASDVGTLAESAAAAVTQNAPDGTDTGALSEASSLSSSFGGVVVDQVGADAGTLAEAAYTTLPVTGTDSATLAEGTSLAVGQNASPSDSDDAVLGEAVNAADAEATVSETGTCVEDGAVLCVLVDTETATVDDILAALLAEPVATDTGALVESSVADYGFSGVAEARIAFLPRLSADPDWVPRLSGTLTMEP